jgi:CubicO group peptidase (beta-lactamase class C family)
MTHEHEPALFICLVLSANRGPRLPRFRRPRRAGAQSPHGIIRQSFGFATRPADDVPRGRLNGAQIIKELNAYVAKLVAADMLAGAVLVARDGKPIFKRAYGLNNSKTANRIDTKFDLASMSKMFTSVAIAQLVQQGKLSYDDTIGKLLPEYPNRQAAEKVTIHHLLTHTSGIVDFLDKQEYQAARHGGKSTFLTMQDWFPFFASDPLSFEPGAKNDYSNGNFIVAGAVIEKITGQSYFDYVREHIFQPAGMSNTVFTVGNGNSAGGGLSTIGDLLKFDIALRQHKLLSAKYTDIILTPKVETGGGEGYGYGFEISQVNGKRIVGHSGGTTEVDNKFDAYLDNGYTVIALTKPHASKNVTRKLKELITQGSGF